ncbi:MAG: glutamate 5-kinase [Candidatus Anoxymicrobium japonicum]|uniref:Glutamate 5-kinase n=1 Tax=Candidatus Anoxymicrobium japonicum TaxID=2013648 RepID=A0A2N3G8C6_9ACTN|nr:MAG: glutamate 5-kinase [Candidatus Anoxymicrobium japonicum]
MDVKRMVVKVGTATITEQSGKISRELLEKITSQIVDARARGIDVALVSSGAIQVGMRKLGLARRPDDIEILQAVAAVGQGILMHMYTDIFAGSGTNVGQVLLTRYGLNRRQQYLNVRHTLEKLFEMDVVPIINENDTVATEEITFGDNDMLAALVASLVGADLLVLLTDTSGLFTEDPRKNGNAKLVKRVTCVTAEIEGFSGDAGDRGLGGMSSKVQAARIASAAGVNTIIADGRVQTIIMDIVNGKAPGTFFHSTGNVASMKHWIGYARISSGRLTIDAGAVDALLNKGKSLLPVGVLEVEGDFDVGDCVEIADPEGKVIARGLSSYSALEARRVLGLRTDQIIDALGEAGEEIIHRDELTLLE